MTRRTTTLTTAAVVLAVLVCVAFLLPVPYVTMRPGPTQNVLASSDGGAPIVEIRGHKTYPTDGSLSLTTVSVTSAGQQINLVEAFQTWFSSDDALVPRDVIYDPDQSVQEAEAESATQMADSQEVAAVAALRLLGDHVREIDSVGEVQSGGPADGELEEGDVFVSVDGQRESDSQAFIAAIRDREPGDDVDLQVRRDGERVDVTLTTQPSPDDPDVPVIGVGVTVDFDLPFDVAINLGGGIGGPSAGTVFALAIYDKLTPDSLTGGHDIAGTGSITPDGLVGPIGGIQQKIAGAEEQGISVFLVPEANCEEALGADVDVDAITLVEVKDLGDAVDALTALADDEDADVPTCG